MTTANESSADRIVRIMFGIILGLVSLTSLTGNVQTIVLVLSGILLITGILGVCPLYMLFGISTKR